MNNNQVFHQLPMTSTSSVLSVNSIATELGTFYCINCGRKLIECLAGIQYDVKLKCPKCKARFIINKITNQLITDSSINNNQ